MVGGLAVLHDLIAPILSPTIGMPKQSRTASFCSAHSFKSRKVRLSDSIKLRKLMRWHSIEVEVQFTHGSVHSFVSSGFWVVGKEKRSKSNRTCFSLTKSTQEL